jgi:hypothetical protein
MLTSKAVWRKMSNIIKIMNYETERKVQIMSFFEVLPYFLWTNYGKS